MNIERNTQIIIYSISYFLKRKIFGQKDPLIGGLVINERCNLNCKQCRVSNRKDIPDLSYMEIRKGLRTLYDRGIRLLYIEGGEPFLWTENKYQLGNIVNLARRMGFLWISIYTNGTFPLDVSADSFFVSLDGLKKTNNELRARGRNIFDKIIRNIQKSSHPNIIINFTINQKNECEIETFCEEMETIKQIKGIFFNFHTPYYGYDELFLDTRAKRPIIRRLLLLKNKYKKILNSKTALENILNNKWERPSDICFIYANNNLYKCCRAIGKSDVCKNCGYLMYAEIENVLKLSRNSIISAINYLPKK
ncbi:radical SAM protein [Candidatus Dojkabacteria bacterium]|nr:radical SAM protein [Candidatus Dojkabacteria bacterium]